MRKFSLLVGEFYGFFFDYKVKFYVKIFNPEIRNPNFNHFLSKTAFGLHCVYRILHWFTSKYTSTNILKHTESVALDLPLLTKETRTQVITLVA